MGICIAGNLTEKIYFIRHRYDLGSLPDMALDFIKLSLTIERFRCLQMKNQISP